ncbi:hypothetical protein NC652_005670 [Populus alba x Populus x berolinensis]|nr:hypothetical protein NC652_005670 [Populus alba x Populus x berolinensis]
MTAARLNLFGLLSVNICQVVKKRMQTGQFASAPDAVHLIVTEEGFKGLYAAKTDLKDPESAIIDGAFDGNEAFSEA